MSLASSQTQTDVPQTGDVSDVDVLSLVVLVVCAVIIMLIVISAVYLLLQQMKQCGIIFKNFTTEATPCTDSEAATMIAQPENRFVPSQFSPTALRLPHPEITNGH